MSNAKRKKAREARETGTDEVSNIDAGTTDISNVEKKKARGDERETGD
jgi:hypothetical protein